MNRDPDCRTRILARIASEPGPLRLEEGLDFVAGEECGGVVTFSGVVRAKENGKRIAALDYDHHPVLAQKALEEVLLAALARHEVARIACIHRTGRVPVGEASVVIAVGAPHRAAAFRACEFVIDELKAKVPIWKRVSA